MTDALDNILEKLYQVPRNLEEIVMNVAGNNADVMEDLNREQLSAGIRADGSQITPPYAPVTVALKKKKGAPFNRVTLFDEGAYHASLKARRFGNKFEMQGQDWKSQDLNDKYGEIEGLTADNLAFFSEYIKPEVIGELRVQLTR